LKQRSYAAFFEEWSRISLLEARDLAAKEKKPILIWSMDGNPLAAG
jgi:hypothetical protein